MTLFQGPAEVACRLCGSPLPQGRRNGVPPIRQRWCSDDCRSRGNSARRGDSFGRGAGRRFPRVRYAARLAIFERDRWTCGICHAPIDPALTFPHPGAASIDHIDPDGPHDAMNWQAAHLACNTSKGRKVRPGADPKLRRRAAA